MSAQALDGNNATPAPSPVAATASKNTVTGARLIAKHPLAIRWFHWVNFPVLFLMIWSGILILWANPQYPTKDYALPVPNRISLYKWGVAFAFPPSATERYKVLKADEENYPRPEAQRYDIPIGFRLAEGMAWHFALAWAFTLNGIAYALYLAFSGQWRTVLPRKNSFGEAFKVVLADVGLWKKPLPPGKYNHAQRIAYSAVIVMGGLMVLTGLAIYKPAQLSWLANLLGGYQFARTVHFVVTFLFLGFFLVHIAQVARTGWNNFRGMITGYEIEKTKKAEISAP